VPDLLTSGCLQLALDASSLKGVLGVVFGVGLLIFIHELGHFLAAKWAGVKVEVFSLGFGHRLAGFERGGTDYRISALPLGGYVRMLGQADDDPFQASTQDPADFRNKSPGKRFVILVAGVVMNLLLAAVGFVLAFGLGIEFTAAEIGAVDPGSPAARADLRPGDIILQADGTDVLGLNDLQTVVAVSNGEMTLTVLRDGKSHQVVAHPVRGIGDRFTRLGIHATSVIGDVAPGSPLQGKVLPATLAQSDRVLNVSPVGSRRGSPSTRSGSRRRSPTTPGSAAPRTRRGPRPAPASSRATGSPSSATARTSAARTWSRSCATSGRGWARGRCASSSSGPSPTAARRGRSSRSR
jgi:membrane-associated protease RseP (regulator of RpoE activity)